MVTVVINDSNQQYWACQSDHQEDHPPRNLMLLSNEVDAVGLNHSRRREEAQNSTQNPHAKLPNQVTSEISPHSPVPVRKP